MSGDFGVIGCINTSQYAAYGQGLTHRSHNINDSSWELSRNLHVGFVGGDLDIWLIDHYTITDLYQDSGDPGLLNVFTYRRQLQVLCHFRLRAKISDQHARY